MANEPSLSELSNMKVDPDLGTAYPRVVWDSSQLNHTINGVFDNINANARINAQRQQQQYSQFLNDYKDFAKDVNNISKMETMPQDRPALKQKMIDVLGKIGKDPKSFYSGLSGIEQDLASLTSDATKSRSDYAFDKANRMFLDRQPSAMTDENKQTVEGFGEQPLEVRKPYLLNMPVDVDLNKVIKGIFTQPDVHSKYPKSVLTPDGKFIETSMEDTVRFKPFIDKWNFYGQYGPGKRYAKQLYDEQPPEMKAKYEDGGGGQTKFWEDIGVARFGDNKDITTNTGGRKTPNPFALDYQKAQERAKLSREKYGQQVDLIGKRLSGQMSLAEYREQMKAKYRGKTPVKGSDGKTHYVDRGNFLDNEVEDLKDNAQNPENAVYRFDGQGGAELVGYKIETSGDTKKVFGVPKVVDGKTVVTPANELLLSPDGNGFISSFGKLSEKNGVKFIDSGTDPDIKFGAGEFKAKFGKAQGLTKQVHDFNPDTDASVDEIEPTQPKAEKKKTGILTKVKNIFSGKKTNDNPLGL